MQSSMTGIADVQEIRFIVEVKFRSLDMVNVSSMAPNWFPAVLAFAIRPIDHCAIKWSGGPQQYLCPLSGNIETLTDFSIVEASYLEAQGLLLAFGHFDHRRATLPTLDFS